MDCFAYARNDAVDSFRYCGILQGIVAISALIEYPALSLRAVENRVAIYKIVDL